jgi:hypothetical protein
MALLLWIASYVRFTCYQFETESYMLIVYLAPGRLGLWLHQVPEPNEYPDDPTGPIFGSKIGVTRRMTVPLPVVTGALGFLGLPYWFRRRPIPPGHCRSCGYDLTGNVSGRCSECGREIEEEGFVRPPDGKEKREATSRN